jgi:tetratricopeptide (TPR) repeat protein
MFYRECHFRTLRLAHLSLLLCLSIFFAACGHSTAAFLTKGEEYFQKRKFNDALMQFRSAAESDKDSAKAHWGLARAYENLGLFNETLDELRKTVELDDANLDAKAKLANYFLLVQPPMIAEAEKLRQEILEIDPKFVEGHILTASIMAAQGRPDRDIVATVNNAIALDPKRVETYVSLERLYMTRNNAAEAEAAIKKGIEANPASTVGYAEYGRFLMYADRDVDAETQFNKAIEADQASIEPREAIADFYVTSRQYDKAEAAYKDLIRIQENSPESRLELAEFYAASDRKDEAIAVLDDILNDTPEYVRARYKLGQIHLDRKEFGKVDEQLKALLKMNDEDGEALQLKARSEMQQNRSEDAVKDLDEVLKKYPSGREPLYLMAQARLSLGQIDQAKAFIADLDRYHPNYLKSGLLKIQAAFLAGDPETAIKQANDVLTKADAATTSPDLTAQAIQELHVRALSSRGLAYLDLGKTAEAKKDLQDILNLSPHSSSAMVNLAKEFTAEKNNSGALDLYERALAADPQYFDAVSGIVGTCIKMGQTSKAHAKTDELIAVNASKNDMLAGLHYLKSTVFAAEKNTAAQESELTQSIAADENYLASYSAYAALLVSQNRADEAIAQYQKAVEKRPSAQTFTLLGILEDARGNMAESEKDYRKALEITPDSPIAANNLAWMIAETSGNLDEALQLATAAVAKNQTVAGFYDTLGYVYMKKGLYSPAVQQFKKAVALDEANMQKTGAAATPGYRVRLGMALAKTGDKESARREAENSLRRINDLSQREVSDARGILASL